MRERRDTRTPAKKNRTIPLDPTEEEDDGASRSRSGSGSPPLPVSPPQEMKIRVRQISQGVEDLSWRNIMASTSENDFDIGPSTSPHVLPPSEELNEEKYGDEKQDSAAASDASIEMSNGEGEIS